LARTVRGGAAGEGKHGFLRNLQPGDAVTLRELAEFSRSWVFEEATLGVAALTSWYNHASITPGIVPTDISVNRSLMEAAGGKKVAFIGHFRNVENYSDACELTILERSPSQNDLPDPACEFVLPQQDLVILTGLTLTNKTIVRLLELCRSATVAISGPSSVCANVLGEYGVDIIGGTEVLDIEAMKYTLQSPTGGKFGEAVRKITLEPDQTVEVQR
jgi:uncharacterized protein (DUF4213/DUF364 family)